MEKPVGNKHYSGTVLFFVIQDIRNKEVNISYDSIVQLNKIVGQSKLVTLVGKKWVGSTISGLFVLIPDQLNVIPHDHIVPMFEAFAKGGISVRCGVSRGDILTFVDSDDEINFLGSAINITARLAYSKDNSGCLVHREYVNYAQDYPSKKNGAFLKSCPTIVIKGKPHDHSGFECCAISKPKLTILDNAIRERIPLRHSRALHPSGLVLAYDLTHFNAGDESELSKRVASLVSAIHILKQDSKAMDNASLYFCPGGDGGIVFITNVRQEAPAIANNLRQKLMVESLAKSESIRVNARIGVHYGVVTLYKDVGGRQRPTGQTCFIADEIISDDAATNALVYSQQWEDVISNGSRTYLEEHFIQLPPLKSGPAKDVLRYTPRGAANAPGKNPLLDIMFGPTSIWQPDK